MLFSKLVSSSVRSIVVRSNSRIYNIVSIRSGSSNRSGNRGKGIIRKFLSRSFVTVFVVIGGYYGFKYIEKATRPTFPNEKKKKVVILGSGWGAMSALNHLNPGQFEITVVSPRNYFLFTPMLPSVTVGTVNSRSVVEPVRKLILKHHKNQNVKFFEAECMSVDADNKTICCRDESGIQGSVSSFKLDYDILITAIGANNNTFNTPGVKENCYFLKEMKDAEIVRHTIVDLIESACYPGQPKEERKRLLHFVVVGGGPTGVEFASELRDFLREDIPNIYPCVKDDFKVTLVQSADHILNTYDEQISMFTENNFDKEDNNVDVLTGTRVIELNDKEVTMLDKSTGRKYIVPYGMCVWSTGVAPRKLTSNMMKSLQNCHDKRARALLTDQYLRVKGTNGIFALGDCSTIEQDKMIAKANELFQRGDINGDGQLTLEEFSKLIEIAKQEYPQVSLFFKKAQKNLDKFFAEMDTSGDQMLDLDEFKKMLITLDSQLKSLPATAQVASQQGKYIGHLLNKTNGSIIEHDTAVLEKNNVKPFEYKHFGSFAYVGDNKAVLEVPFIGALNGWWVMWLWRAAYASECASTRTKVLLVTDWIKAYVFGRDSSRI